MSVRLRKNGSLVCAAENPEEDGDVRFDDGLHGRLVELGVLRTADNGHTWFFSSPDWKQPAEPENYQGLLDLKDRAHDALLMELYALRQIVRGEPLNPGVPSPGSPIE